MTPVSPSPFVSQNESLDTPLSLEVSVVTESPPLSVTETVPEVAAEDDVLTTQRSSKRRYSIVESDDDSSVHTDVSTPSIKKGKIELPEAVSIKKAEKPLPYPFPLPSNYRPEVEVCLKTGKMTKEARRHFISAIASAMFSYKRYIIATHTDTYTNTLCIHLCSCVLHNLYWE